MKSNLDQELVYSYFKNGKLDEKVASERLIAIIESDSDQDKRVRSVEILGKIGLNKHKIFKIMENLLVSDSNEQLRSAAANIILDNFFDKGLEVINWALEHKNSPKCLLIILKALKHINPKLVDSYVKAELNNFKENQPEIIEPYWDLESLPYSLDWKIEIFVNCKFLSFLNENYGKNYFDYSIEDEEFVKIAIIGLEAERVSDVIGLEDLTELKYLDLSGNQIREINFMENFPKLECLRLKENQIKEIKGLEKLTNLSELYLSNNQINEIKGLDKLKNLAVLDLSKNNISIIKGLESLCNLYYIFLQGNNIEKIEGIENLENLRELNLGENQISRIEGLNNLENLHELDLGENQISKIEGLDTLINLGTLYLYNNQIATIEEIEAIESLKDLLFLDLRNNLISEEEIYQYIKKNKKKD